MSRLAKLPLALLAAMALLFLWGGTAIADTTPTDAACATQPLPPDCPTTDAQSPVGDGTIGTPPAVVPPAVVPPAVVPPAVVPPAVVPPAMGDPTGGGSTQPSGNDQQPTTSERAVVPAYTGTAELAPAGGSDSGSPAGDPGTGASGATPDPTAVVTCIGNAVQKFLTGLQATLGTDVGDLATQIQTGIDGLSGLDGPTKLKAFLDGLPKMVQDAGPGMTADVQALLTQAGTDIAACLPELPTTGPAPVSNPTPQAGTQPVDNQPGVFYENCDAARQAGAAPINRGEPGYRSELDRDNDGVACEDDTVNAQPISDTGQLAYTGTDPKPMLAAGAGLLLLGTGLLRLGRRRT